jgi:hypothetical protein
MEGALEPGSIIRVRVRLWGFNVYSHTLIAGKNCKREERDRVITLRTENRRRREENCQHRKSIWYFTV